MNTNVNLEAAVGVLAFMGAAFVLGLAALFMLHALKTRRRARARMIGLAALGGVGLYLALLVAFSFVSREKVLALGEEKHFCELDCHISNAVTSVRQTKTLGREPDEATARGVFYVVTVRTRFDERTISPGRGDAPLVPNSRVVTVTDAAGNSYSPSAEGERALDAEPGSRSTPLDTPLRPGESYETLLVFDLPLGVEAPELLLREGAFVTRFIIGHENSFWHGKTKFNLES